MKIFLRVIQSFFLTTFVFGLLGWVYIVINAEVHPITLTMPLTHLLPYPREDTFGTVCFSISLFSFFVWNIIRDKHSS